MINQFSEKLNNLPSDIQEILLSDFGRQAEIEIGEKYKLSDENFYLLGEIVSLLYFKDLMVDDLVDFVQSNFELSRKKATQISLDIIGSRLLVAEEYFGKEKIREFIVSLGGNPDNFNEYAVKIKKEISGEKENDPLELNLNKANEEISNPVFKLEKEKDDSKVIFSSMLEYFLADHVNPFLDDYNMNLIELISTDKGFKKELENLLHNNSELITHERFEMDGSLQTPSVGNWIQDFITENGSEMFDNLTLSRYMTSSKNARILNFDDRKLVQKLLLLYRNLKFFPESMAGNNPEDWEIIPTDRGVGNLTKARAVSGPPKTEEEKEIDVIKMEEEKYAVGGLERLALEEEINKKKKLEELKIVAGKYRDGSLEKSAILEEIRKLDK